MTDGGTPAPDRPARGDGEHCPVKDGAGAGAGTGTILNLRGGGGGGRV